MKEIYDLFIKNNQEVYETLFGLMHNLILFNKELFNKESFCSPEISKYIVDKFKLIPFNLFDNQYNVSRYELNGVSFITSKKIADSLSIYSFNFDIFFDSNYNSFNTDFSSITIAKKIDNLIVKYTLKNDSFFININDEHEEHIFPKQYNFFKFNINDKNEQSLFSDKDAYSKITNINKLNLNKRFIDYLEKLNSLSKEFPQKIVFGTGFLTSDEIETFTLLNDINITDIDIELKKFIEKINIKSDIEKINKLINHKHNNVFFS